MEKRLLINLDATGKPFYYYGVIYRIFDGISLDDLKYLTRMKGRGDYVVIDKSSDCNSYTFDETEECTIVEKFNIYEAMYKDSFEYQKLYNFH